MVEKFCARSHGQPVLAVRSAAIISMRRVISREGVTFAIRMIRNAPGALRCYQGSLPPRKQFTVQGEGAFHESEHGGRDLKLVETLAHPDPMQAGRGSRPPVSPEEGNKAPPP